MHWKQDGQKSATARQLSGEKGAELLRVEIECGFFDRLRRSRRVPPPDDVLGSELGQNGVAALQSLKHALLKERFALGARRRRLREIINDFEIPLKPNHFGNG
jgi:hypothetical protein